MNALKFIIYRQGDSFRLRKVVIDLVDGQNVFLDRTRMFAGPFLKSRLTRRLKRMAARGLLMVGASQVTIPYELVTAEKKLETSA